MQTIEQRLEQWKNELLDLTNRNRLLSFNTSTSRTSSISLVAPETGDVYRTLIDGKPLLIVGDERDDVAAIDEPMDPEIALAVIGAGDDPPPRPSAPPKAADAPLPPPIARPGTVLSAMSTEKTNNVAARLFTQARASEQEQGINTLFLALGRLKWREKPLADDRQGQPIGAKDGWRFAPLVLLPLKLEEITRKTSYRILAAGEDSEFN